MVCGRWSMGEMFGDKDSNSINPFFFTATVADMQDFSQLSSKMVTEVLMLEIKMAPAAKAYLISGFPRSMRDVVEYSDKVCNCVR